MIDRYHYEYKSKAVAAGSSCTIEHYIGEGEFDLDFASLMPQTGSEAVPVWSGLVFVYEPSTQTVTREIKAGYATTEIPMIIKGPIPIKGPGYFYFRMISRGATDTLEVSFTYSRSVVR